METEIKMRCQSCAMPLGDGFNGTNQDGTENAEYCKFCFSSGAFTEPDRTCGEMIEESVSHMVRVLKIPEEKAREMARTTIPKLRRWRT